MKIGRGGREWGGGGGVGEWGAASLPTRATPPPHAPGYTAAFIYYVYSHLN